METQRDQERYCHPGMPGRRIGPFLALLLFTSCSFITRATINEDYRSSLKKRNTELAGWRFVIDAGHGGIEKGAISSENVRATEADVNLAVSLLLGGMLESSGADVFYTRKADIAVSDQFESLGQELRVRSKLSNDLDPDFFISIHHNSSAKPHFNKIEVYFKLMTQGAAKRLAEGVARELSLLYPDLDSEVIAGNFSVIRNSSAEGILVECAYLSNRAASGSIISLPVLRQEAEAIFEAILKYSRHGNPRISLDPDTDGINILFRDHQDITEITARFSAGGREIQALWAMPDSPSYSVRLEGLEYHSADITCTNVSGRTAQLEARPFADSHGDTRRKVLVLFPPDADFKGEIIDRPAYSVSYIQAGTDRSESLRAIERSRSDLCVVIEDAPRESIAHYWRSSAGKKAATAVGTAIHGKISGGSHYFLNHTSMPAIVIRTPGKIADVNARLLAGLDRYF